MKGEIGSNPISGAETGRERENHKERAGINPKGPVTGPGDTEGRDTTKGRQGGDSSTDRGKESPGYGITESGNLALD